MRDLHYNSRQTDVTSISEILGVGIPNNNPIHHITRHCVTDFERKTKQILQAAKRVEHLFCFRKGCSFSIYVASTTVFSQ